MSVAFALYKVRDDIDYVGHYTDFIKPSECTPEYLEAIEASLNYPTEAIDVEDAMDKIVEWMDEQQAKSWSDGQIHSLLDWSYYRLLHRDFKGWHRQEKKINRFNLKTFDSGWLKKKYLACDEINAYYGWCLNHRFFARKMTFGICTTPKEIKDFFKKYCDKSDESIALLNRVLSDWEDGCIFVCSW